MTGNRKMVEPMQNKTCTVANLLSMIVPVSPVISARLALINVRSLHSKFPSVKITLSKYVESFRVIRTTASVRRHPVLPSVGVDVQSYSLQQGGLPARPQA